MKAIKDVSLRKLIESKKYKDLLDFSSFECRVAIMITIIIDVIFFMSLTYLEPNTLVNSYIEYLDDIVISIIGFLGFVIAALAILIGAITNKVYKVVYSSNKIEMLERVLLSFYLHGLACAIFVMLGVIIHFVGIIPVNVNVYIFIIGTSIFVYLATFIIFYAVKLIGNCIELFYIINDIQMSDEDSIDYKAKYDTYRMASLEYMVLNSAEEIEKYKNKIGELINDDVVSEDSKRVLREFFKQHFRE